MNVWMLTLLFGVVVAVVGFTLLYLDEKYNGRHDSK